jgi:hypothetical protein
MTGNYKEHFSDQKKKATLYYKYLTLFVVLCFIIMTCFTIAYRILK